MTAQGVPGGDVISVEGLCMRYRTLGVLRDVAFRVRRGEVVALLGPNGAGKTTTVEILEGFRRPSAGQIRVLDANPLTGDRRWRARTGIVLQSWRDHGKWRVREFHDLLTGIRRELGTTVLMTTHDLDEAGKLADRIIILTGGRIVAQGTAAELGNHIAGEGEVRWARAGQHFRRFTPDAVSFVRHLLALFFLRHRELKGSLFTIGALMLPGTLGMFVAFGMMLMVQYLPADREDGTLLRARATPGGIGGYLAGKLVTSSLSVLIYLVMIGVPGALITGGLVIAPLVLKRMARRESGSRVAGRRARALQRTG